MKQSYAFESPQSLDQQRIPIQSPSPDEPTQKKTRTRVINQGKIVTSFNIGPLNFILHKTGAYDQTENQSKLKNLNNKLSYRKQDYTYKGW